MAKRRFELVEGTSSKFWEVSVHGSSFTVTFGRIGSNGQTKTKKCKDAKAAAAEAKKLVAEKVKKGYSASSGGKAAKPAAKATKPANVAKPETTSPFAAVTSELARALDAAGGNEKKEKAAMKIALAQFLKLAGAPADAEPGDYQAAEFFAEGGTYDGPSVPPVFELMKDCDDDNQARLWQLLGDVAGY